ncbi:unnamed protein product [Arctogadus glacialis]
MEPVAAGHGVCVTAAGVCLASPCPLRGPSGRVSALQGSSDGSLLGTGMKMSRQRSHLSSKAKTPRGSQTAAAATQRDEGFSDTADQSPRARVHRVANGKRLAGFCTNHDRLFRQIGWTKVFPRKHKVIFCGATDKDLIDGHVSMATRPLQTPSVLSSPYSLR